MKKIILSSTALFALLATTLCKTAAGPEESFYQVLPANWQQAEYLALGKKEIRAIPENVDLPQLKSLDLNDNKITAISNNWNAPRLEYLYLHNNDIRAIGDGLNLPRLKMLYLGKNKIETISGTVNLPELEYLHIFDNKLTAIPDGWQLDNLTHLNLSNNDIQYINPQQLLDQFPKLKTIDLSGNMNLDARFIEDLREEAKKAGRGDTLKIIADNIGVGMDVKG